MPYAAYTPTWADGKYVREFESLYENLGISTDNYDLDYSLEKFANGKTIFAYDLSPGTVFHTHLQSSIREHFN